MSRVSDRLEPVQAKALASSIALEADKLEPDELDIVIWLPQRSLS